MSSGTPSQTHPNVIFYQLSGHAQSSQHIKLPITAYKLFAAYLLKFVILCKLHRKILEVYLVYANIYRTGI